MKGERNRNGTQMERKLNENGMVENGNGMVENRNGTVTKESLEKNRISLRNFH